MQSLHLSLYRQTHKCRYSSSGDKNQMWNEESETEVEVEVEVEVEENPITSTSSDTTITQIVIPLTNLHKRNDDVVFPPFNHENLPLQKPTTHIIPPSPSLSPPPAKHGSRDVVRRWARQARAHLLLFLRAFKDSKWLNTNTNNNNSRWFGCGVAVGATVLVWWFYVRRRRKGRMLLAIREKDEKIKQLLHQIAQMNQLLLSLHKSSLSQGGGVT